MDIVVVPSLKSELMSSTALTPTQHKGGSKMAMVVGIAAAVAIPIAAPALAGSLVASGTIAASMGTAASIGIGAALGAGAAYATGGDWRMGAIGGGIGGGIGGYNTTFTGPPTGYAGLGSSVSSPTAYSATTGANVMLPGAMAPAPAAGLTSSITPSSAGVAGGAAGGAGGYFPQPAGGFTNALTSTPVNSAGITLSGSGVTVPNLSAQFGAPPAAPSLTQRASNFFNDLPSKAGNFISELPEKVLTSEAAQQAAGKAVTMGIGNVLADDEPNMTAEEQARMADLAKARGFQQDQLNAKQAASAGYAQQAANINPYYYGQQALTTEQNRLARAQESSMRQLGNPNMASATQRRNALDRSRLGAFDRGRQEAEAKRLQYTQAALATSPTGSAYAGDMAGDLAAADESYKRKQKEVTDYASMFKPIADEIFGSTNNSKPKENS